MRARVPALAEEDRQSQHRQMLDFVVGQLEAVLERLVVEDKVLVARMSLHTTFHELLLHMKGATGSGPRDALTRLQRYGRPRETTGDHGGQRAPRDTKSQQ